MLRRTFQHISGIGPKTEARLWTKGIADWQTLLDAPETALPPKVRGALTAGAFDSLNAISQGDPAYFANRLPGHLQWRYFSDFRHETAYLDIETNGMDAERGIITTIVLYDGRTIRHYVQGRNLDDFAQDIAPYKVLVTYNGKCFDIPYIERYFGITIRAAQIDLRYVLAKLGYKGGLKACETALGIDRGTLRGVDGYFAVLLWYDYQQNRNEKALETLLAYNAEDVVNLEQLMVTAFNLHVAQTPFADQDRLPMPYLPANPFRADGYTIQRIQHALHAYGSGGF